MFKKYFENRRHFKCAECEYEFTLGFWGWLCVPHMDMWRYRYVKCPNCGVRHWLKAEEVIK